MEITNFLNVDIIATFTMSLLIIELIVHNTKELPLIKKIPTRFYTLIISILHLVVINKIITLFPLPSVVGIYVLICNAFVISTILCGGYDLVNGKLVLTKLNNINTLES